MGGGLRMGGAGGGEGFETSEARMASALGLLPGEGAQSIGCHHRRTVS
jgi:hypothetical protein